jgi:glycosyltransferase involved in cell wall biosynthesis
VTTPNDGPAEDERPIADPDARRPRLLYVTTCPTWPLDGGYAIRSHALAEGCAANGDCDLVHLAPSDERREVPPALGGRVQSSVVWVRRQSAVATLWRWLVRGRPWPWARIDWERGRDEVAERIRSGDHDGVLVSSIDAWPAIAPELRSAVVIDLDDVESAKIEHRRANADRSYRGRAGWFVRIRDLIDLPRWRRIEAQILATAHRVVVCSEHDRRALGGPTVFAVPNPYPDLPAVDRSGPRGRVLSFIGSLTTVPNREAVRFLVDQVMPLVWRRDPTVQLRLVGRGGADIAALHRPPQIEVVGYVDDLTDELQRADVALAPFLSGGGTRVKILESFHHRIPVVSTTVGAEGIDAIDGEHLLLRDDPAGFADACLAVLDDPVLASRLVDDAERFVHTHYSPSAVEAAVARAVLGS